MSVNRLESGSVSQEALKTQQEVKGQISIGESTRDVIDWTWSKTGHPVVNAVKYIATQIFELGSWVKNALLSLVAIDFSIDSETEQREVFAPGDSVALVALTDGQSDGDEGSVVDPGELD